MKKFNHFMERYSYISWLILCAIVFLSIHLSLLFFADVNIFDKFPTKDDMDIGSAIIGSSFTLLGFIFTAYSIIMSFNKNTEFMKKFEKYGHTKILNTCFIMSALLSFIPILICPFGLIKEAFILLICSVIEMVVIVSYISKIHRYDSDN